MDHSAGRKQLIGFWVIAVVRLTRDGRLRGLARQARVRRVRDSGSDQEAGQARGFDGLESGDLGARG